MSRHAAIKLVDSRMAARALSLFLLCICATATLAAPATAFRVTLPETVILEELFDFTVEAIDDTGAVDPNYTGVVTFASLGSEPMLPPNYTFTASDAGVHVFSAKMTMYGDGDIIVLDSSNSSITGSDTTNVRFAPGPTQKFVIAAPATANLGQPFNFTVTAAHLDGTPTGDYTRTVTFDNTGVSNPANYTFTPADGGTKTFTATPTAGGNVRIRVHDVAYPLVSDERAIEIGCPGFTVTASNDGPICFTQPPTLTASTSETGVTFAWFGPIGWSAAGQIVTGRAGYRGPYTVRMTHPNGCMTSGTTEVTLSRISPEVEPADHPNDDLCDTMERTYSIVDSATNGPYSNLSWKLNGSGRIVSGQGTTSVTIAADSDESGMSWQPIYLSVSGTNGDGCTFVDQPGAALRVQPRPVVVIDTPATGCAGTPRTANVVFTPPLPVETTTNLQWSIENGTITSHIPPNIRYTVSGNGDAVITLTATTAYCSYSTTRTVSGTGGPSATIASASRAICAGDAVQIPVTLTGEAPFTITWSDGVQQTGITGSFTRTVTPDRATNYSIVSVIDASCSGEGSGNVEVTPRTSALITRQPKTTAVGRGSRATLTVEVEPDVTSIQWYQGLRGDHSQPVSGGTSLELTTPPITQTTSFWAEIVTSCGTVASNAATVTVSSRRRAARHP
jgi:hypothetical protein